MKDIYKKFFTSFNIRPRIKKNSILFLTLTEDIYPCVTSDIVLELEEILLDWSEEVELYIRKDKGKYSYFDSLQFRTRQEALLAALLEFRDNKYIYDSVRRIFKEDANAS